MAEKNKVSKAKRQSENERLMPDVERVYEAEYNVKARRMEAFPEYYETASIIRLNTDDTRRCHAGVEKEIIKVKLSDMPYLNIPVLVKEDFSIIKPCTVPEPCPRHAYQMVLPNEYIMSRLPITKIHRELATFALENYTNFIASENALTCLTQWNRPWLIPLSICDIIGPDGIRQNVLVLDSEFSTHKESAGLRTYKAFRHLLEQALKTSRLEREIIGEQLPTEQNTDVDYIEEDGRLSIAAGGESAAEDENEDIKILPNVVYTFGAPEKGVMVPNARCVPLNAGFSARVRGIPLPPVFPLRKQSIGDSQDSLLSPPNLYRFGGYGQASTSNSTGPARPSGQSVRLPDDGLRTCMCPDTAYENLPFRSFRKWQLRKEGTAERQTIIVHSSHKGKDVGGELLLEPQPDLGASAPSPDAVRRAATSLMLHKRASLLNVSLDGRTGKVEKLERLSAKTFAKRNRDAKRQVINTILAVLGQLQDLQPGHYVLQHEDNHGPIATLMAPLSMRMKRMLHLNFRTYQPMLYTPAANSSSAAASMQPSTSRT